MNAALAPDLMARAASPFDLDDDATYRRWRAWKLAAQPASVDALTVQLRDPRRLTPAERAALLDRIARANMAIYRSAMTDADPALPRALGAQLGLHRLDANWLAGEDGVSRITVSAESDGRGGFIPYTDRAIRWHTDGYYHAAGRRIHGMILHCVRPAPRGGENALFDPERVYIALRDASVGHVRALMQPDAMTIPARDDDDGVARAAQTGPVFSVDDTAGGCLHLRYTARKRSIEWKDDAATRAALSRLEAVLANDSPNIFRIRLQPGMGIVGHNVLHDRSAFDDDASRPRLLYRARFLDRVVLPGRAPWRIG